MEINFILMTFTSLAFNVLSSILILFLAKAIYKLKPSIRTIIVYSLLHAIIVIVASRIIVSLTVYFIFLKLIKPFIILLISIISVKFLLNTALKQAVIICSFNTLIMGFSETIVFFLMKLIGFNPQNSSQSLITYIFSYFAIYAVAYLFIFIIVNFNMISELPKTVRPKAYRFIIISFLIPIIIMFSYAVQTLYNPKGPTFYLVLIIAILSNIYINFYSISNIVKIEINEQELELQRFYNKSMSEVIDKLRMYKHDTGNMLNTINGFLKLNKIDMLSHYIKENIGDMDNTNNLMAIGNIKNAALYGIVSSKMQKAQIAGVNMLVSIIGEINEINNIRISNLCEILGIYMDNAIESSSQSPGKKVLLTIKSLNNSINIIIENTYCIDKINIDKLGELGHSTKGEGRGTGLYIVKKLLSNNNKVLSNTSISRDFFIQSLTIDNNN